MAVQIQFRNDTAANWTSANPTLAVGEMGIETDTDQFKIGDGSTAWTSLGYSFGEFTVSQISDLTATASELNILDGATLTTTELNYVDGVTSAIQDQIDNPTAIIVTDATTSRTLAASDAGKTIVFTSEAQIAVAQNLQYLVIAGGGGGSQTRAGAGGAGGYRSYRIIGNITAV
jgi:hypothetical protein